LIELKDVNGLIKNTLKITELSFNRSWKEGLKSNRASVSYDQCVRWIKTVKMLQFRTQRNM
jgi:hypothetical protein